MSSASNASAPAEELKGSSAKPHAASGAAGTVFRKEGKAIHGTFFGTKAQVADGE